MRKSNMFVAKRVLPFFFAFVFLSSATFAVTFWDAVADFNPVNAPQNPSAVWTYLSNTGTLWTYTSNYVGGFPGYSGLSNQGLAHPTAGYAGCAGDEFYAWAPLIRWTSPVAGTIQLTAYARDSYLTRPFNWTVLKNGAAIDTGPVGTAGVTITKSIVVAIGDTVDFKLVWAGSGDGEYWDYVKESITLIAPALPLPPAHVEGDINRDDCVDIKDLAAMAESWLATCTTPRWCEGADIDESGMVNFADFAKMARNWQMCVVAPSVTVMLGDYLIYHDDSDGHYKAVRLSDGVVTHSHATDAAAVINGLLSSLALCNSPSNPDPNFKAGTKVTLGRGEFWTYQTIVIPPNQNFIFEGGRSLIQAAFTGGDIIRIDSSMNSKFNFPLVIAGGNNTCIRIKPQNPGPEDQTIFTTCELHIEALVGDMDGLTLDASFGNIEFLRGKMKEINLSGGTSPKRAIYIPAPGSGRIVRGNAMKILRINTASQAANVVNDARVYKNLFWINNVDAEGIPINISASNNNTVKKPSTGW